MRIWIWIVPLMMLGAGCSKSHPPQTAAPGAGSNVTALQGSPEPVAPPAAQLPTPPADGNPAAAASQPLPIETAAASSPPSADANVVIPTGSHIRVRIDQEVDTRHNRAGDRFSATLYEPVVVRGTTVLPVGTRFRGHLTASKPSRRLRGRAILGLTLDSFRLRGREYRIETSGSWRESRSHKKHNAAFIGGGGGFGAAIGAIAGGGAGAAIGAAAGGGTGLVGAVITGRKQVGVAAEAPLTFTLREQVMI